jgi:hypothetical protein
MNTLDKLVFQSRHGIISHCIWQLLWFLLLWMHPWYVAFHVQLKCQNIPFTNCPIQLQWGKQLENGIGDLKMTKKMTIVEYDQS